MADYQASTAEGSIKIDDLASLEGRVRDRMEAGAFGYIQGGAEAEWTMQENTAAFDHAQIVPRVLRDIQDPDLHTKLWDIDLKTPLIDAPAAAHGLAHVHGELETAAGVAAEGTIMSVSTYANESVPDIAKAGDGGAQFFQLYMSNDDGFNHWILDQAVASGYKAIVLTADASLGGYREADVKTGFQFPLPMVNLANYANNGTSGEGLNIMEIYARAKRNLSLADIEAVASYTNLPVIVKGVQSAPDATLAIGAGSKGIWVSNHGGRQLDGGPASFDVLPSIAAAVDHQVPIIFDSGIRRGEHAFKALASGADLVAFARPLFYGLNLGGVDGVRSVIQHFNQELTITMQLAGTKTIADIKQTQLLRKRIYDGTL
ncbi:lactate oxidase [Furfurilactobacillus siliginis]|uniref:L-lactate oxidase n=1 Tax=Furfurilactobacillus siliginis TaxID=348151 RepID=A0A0R2L3N5_9LACO|nr:lactate oxidase [Furfurilactobacillus siliginis]KRN96409.1 lactate oxidase [Furfurilactobacillus siliginis]GEK29528.1 L-lactate oxidase [Furfurilactobacillus siliginis]